MIAPEKTPGPLASASAARAASSAAKSMTDDEAARLVALVVAKFGTVSERPIEVDAVDQVAMSLVGVSHDELEARIAARRAEELDRLRPRAMQAAETRRKLDEAKAAFKAAHGPTTCAGFQPGKPQERDDRSCSVGCSVAYKTWRTLVTKTQPTLLALADYVRLQVSGPVAYSEKLARDHERQVRIRAEDARRQARDAQARADELTRVRGVSDREGREASLRVARVAKANAEVLEAQLAEAVAAHDAARTAREEAETLALGQLAPEPAATPKPVAPSAPASTPSKPAAKAGRKSA